MKNCERILEGRRWMFTTEFNINDVTFEKITNFCFTPEYGLAEQVMPVISSEQLLHGRRTIRTYDLPEEGIETYLQHYDPLRVKNFELTRNSILNTCHVIREDCLSDPPSLVFVKDSDTGLCYVT